MSEYPKWLNHPGFAPAVLSDDYARGGGRSAYHAPPGRPAQFPPVIVHNRDDEEWYISKGYTPGTYDHAKVLRQQIAPLPNGYREQEYPRFEEDGSITPDPNPPAVETYEYPKWVPGPSGDEIALDAEEEAAILARKNEPAPPTIILVEDEEETETLSKAEIAAFREWMAAGKPTADIAVAGPLETASPGSSRPTRARQTERGTPEHRELVELCRSAGIKTDARWTITKLRAALDAATAPQENEDAGEEREAEEAHGRGFGAGEGWREDRDGYGDGEAPGFRQEAGH